MSFFPRIPKPKPSDEKISQADAVTETGLGPSGPPLGF
jgi:hypothetical protein